MSVRFAPMVLQNGQRTYLAWKGQSWVIDLPADPQRLSDFLVVLERFFGVLARDEWGALVEALDRLSDGTTT